MVEGRCRPVSSHEEGAMVIDDRQEEYDAGSKVQQLGASSTQENIRKAISCRLGE